MTNTTNEIKKTASTACNVVAYMIKLTSAATTANICLLLLSSAAAAPVAPTILVNLNYIH